MNPYNFFRSHILKDWKEGHQYEHLIKKGKLNFQKKLAAANYNVLSYTPFEYIDTVIEEQNKKYQHVEPNKYFFNNEQMCFTLKTLLSKLKLHPPYIFVGFSEGGWRALLFAEYFKNSV
jgi:pimeloyl-ACP methyl ester carboxylesterase